MTLMYIPPPYLNKSDRFTVIFEGRLFTCRKHWSVQRVGNNFILSISQRNKMFIVEMHITTTPIFREKVLCAYGIYVATRREFRYNLYELYRCCQKYKNKTIPETIIGLRKHFLRMGIYLDKSVFLLVIFLHACRTSWSECLGNGENIEDYTKRNRWQMLLK
jgi:hypothetical protein